MWNNKKNMEDMTKEEIKQRVNDVITDKLGIDDFKDDAVLKEDLRADSLDVVDITMSIEREFDIHVADSEMDGMTEWTVGQLYALVERKLETK